MSQKLNAFHRNFKNYITNALYRVNFILKIALSSFQYVFKKDMNMYQFKFLRCF